MVPCIAKGRMSAGFAEAVPSPGPLPAARGGGEGEVSLVLEQGERTQHPLGSGLEPGLAPRLPSMCSGGCGPLLAMVPPATTP